jgi:hypothetical protein
VLVLDAAPRPSALDEVQICCRSCGREQDGLRWEDWCSEQAPTGDGVIGDEDPMDSIAAYLNQPGECQGADFIEFVCQLMPRTGRAILDCNA